MRLSSFIAVAGVLSISAVSAEPTPPQFQKSVDCKAVNLALTVLKKLGPPATSFCSSYLNIPATKTLSITTTTPTTTVTTSTSTVTVTSRVCEAPKRRSPGQLSNDRSTDLQTGDLELELFKRHNIPALQVIAAAKLSSGCSCLSLTPKTSITATVTAPTSVCTPNGGQCDLSNPGACCGQACMNAVPFPTCFAFF
ncbi:hypothetical protein IG631_07722 [Alternaria alternata]|nr:hypothetical protein IG631_07722 [Alternaria alternata]